MSTQIPNNLIKFPKKKRGSGVFVRINKNTHKKYECKDKEYRVNDKELRGFFIRIWDKGKSYAVQAREYGQGKNKLQTIGDVNLYSAKEARALATGYIKKIKEGKNPRQKTETTEKTSLSSLVDEYSDIKGTAERTHLDMKLELPRTLGSLSDKHLADITIEDVKKWWTANKHRDGSRKKVLRYAKAITNYAIASETTGLEKNVFENFQKGVIGKVRKAPPRTKQILEEDMESWVESFIGLATPHQKWLDSDVVPHSPDENGVEQDLWDKSLNKLSRIKETQRDYILFLMITGKRKGEVANLTWDRVELEGAKKKIILQRESTKGKKKDDHIPMTNLMWHLLSHRYNSPDKHQKFVFPNKYGKKAKTPIDNTVKALKKICKGAGLPYQISNHDFRRTFATHAVICGFRQEDVSLLLAHSKIRNVTEDYILRDHLAKRDKLETIEKSMLWSVHNWIKAYWYGGDEDKYFFTPEPPQSYWDEIEGKDSYYS